MNREERERLKEIADELDPPVRLPGRVPFKSEVDAAAFLRTLASREQGGGPCKCHSIIQSAGPLGYVCEDCGKAWDLDQWTQRPEKPAREELTMIALALKNQGIEGVTPERGVELLIERLYAQRPHAPAQEVEGLRERLLSKKALQAGADAICIAPPAPEADLNEVRIEIEAAWDAAFPPPSGSQGDTQVEGGETDPPSQADAPSVPDQFEPGGDEDWPWPPELWLGADQDRPWLIWDDKPHDDWSASRRYVPATSQDPSDLDEAACEELELERDKERDRANKAEAERDEQDRMRAMNWETLEHWKNKCVAYRAALEELGDEFVRRAKGDRHDNELAAYAAAALLCREKAAELKGRPDV